MSERPREWDYWTCPRCGLELNRRDEWSMQLVDSHLDRHDSERD